MSLGAAYNIGVSGLLAFSSAMETISHNIANLRTPGFRRSETDFASLVATPASQSEQSNGARASVRHIIDTQGIIESTGRPFDLAIHGDGFFVFGTQATAGGGERAYYSRAGDLVRRSPDNEPTRGYLANAAGDYLLAWTASEDGRFGAGGISSLRPVQVTDVAPFPGRATTRASLTATIPATETAVTTQIHYFDAAGAQHNVDLRWSRATTANPWQLQAFAPAGAALGEAVTLTFDGNGNRLPTAPTTLAVGRLFTLDIANLAQRGSTLHRIAYDQNGLGRGDFLTHEIGTDGIVTGRYSSGAVRPLYRIPVALFANPNALTPLSDNRFESTLASGEPELRAPGGDLVRLEPGAVELSNFELADGFTRMIITQRAYSSAAQVVRTVDEMTATVRDLLR
ncbi:MAG: flagellar hook protein FlgE [Pseudomonadota bacterium]